MVKLKHGVKIDGLKQPMYKPLRFLNDLFFAMGLDLVVTDAVAERDNKSLHPDGFAFDFRTRDLKGYQVPVVFEMLTLYLGNDYDVIKYDTHIHVEYQKYLYDMRNLDFQKTFMVTEFDRVD